MRILFWGTPNFAVPSLLALSEEGHDIVGVVTQPDRPAGRGRQIRTSAVKSFAQELGMTLFEPESPNEDTFLDKISNVKADISVVVAYGQILRREVLDIPSLGSINLHASLLPALRGAAPITWSIVHGDTVTGVTVIRMVEKMDAGPIIFQTKESIDPLENASKLTERLSKLGATALVEVLKLFDAGAIKEVEQDGSAATYAPKLNRETARINWAVSCSDLVNLIRGMDGIPGAWSKLGSSTVKLFLPKAETYVESQEAPGTVVEADPIMGLLVATATGVVRIGEVQPEGKKRMTASEWIMGRGVSIGQRFE